MNEDEDRYLEVMGKHALDGASTIILMKHKRRNVILVKITRMDSAITVVIIQCCDDFQVDRFIKCMEWEAAKGHLSHRSFKLQTFLGKKTQ